MLDISRRIDRQRAADEGAAGVLLVRGERVLLTLFVFVAIGAEHEQSGD